MNVRRTSLRSATRSSARNNKGNENNDDSKHQNSAQHEDADDEDDNDNDAAMSTSDTTNVFVLDGVKFDNYNDFVLAKRKRNQQVLMALGFGGNGPSMSSSANKRFKLSQEPSQRGLRSNKKNKSTKNPVVGRSRKSSRIAGDKTKLVALDYNVNEWHRDNSSTVIISGEGCDDTEDAAADGSSGQQQLVFFNDRVNNGDSLCVKEAIELNDPKWIHNDSEMVANDLFQYVQRDTTEPFKEISSTSRSCRDKTKSPTSIMACLEETTEVSKVIEKVEGLSIDNEEWVAKVTPDRIYSVAAHPSESKLICCAGDKRGYVGLWDVDGGSSNNSNNKNINNNAATSPGDEHNTTISTQSDKSSNALFRVHSRPICCLEWLNNENMVTASYDGSVRQLNVETGIFEEIFATYDDSDTTYAEDLGFGLDQGYRYWTQSVAVDHRSKGSSNPCLFVSTSIGDVFHVDLRVAEKQKITFHESLSTKKINTVSLHPNGTTLAASGNDGTTRLFDIRKFHDCRGLSSSSKKSSPKSLLCSQVAGLSVSSSFFSPSGKTMLTTSFANRLNLTDDMHLRSTGMIQPTHSIRHNNQTGRWLTTFQATWHPVVDIFCCGSMNKPRCMEIFDGQGRLLREMRGESLSSVMSRTCFHPSTDKLVMIGGNSSGRVVVVR